MDRVTRGTGSQQITETVGERDDRKEHFGNKPGYCLSATCHNQGRSQEFLGGRVVQRVKWAGRCSFNERGGVKRRRVSCRRSLGCSTQQGAMTEPPARARGGSLGKVLRNIELIEVSEAQKNAKKQGLNQEKIILKCQNIYINSYFML